MTPELQHIINNGILWGFCLALAAVGLAWGAAWLFRREQAPFNEQAVREEAADAYDEILRNHKGTP